LGYAAVYDAPSQTYFPVLERERLAKAIFASKTESASDAVLLSKYLSLYVSGGWYYLSEKMILSAAITDLIDIGAIPVKSEDMDFIARGDIQLVLRKKMKMSPSVAHKIYINKAKAHLVVELSPSSLELATYPSEPLTKLDRPDAGNAIEIRNKLLKMLPDEFVPVVRYVYSNGVEEFEILLEEPFVNVLVSMGLTDELSKSFGVELESIFQDILLLRPLVANIREHRVGRPFIPPAEEIELPSLPVPSDKFRERAEAVGATVLEGPPPPAKPSTQLLRALVETLILASSSMTQAETRHKFGEALAKFTEAFSKRTQIELDPLAALPIPDSISLSDISAFDDEMPSPLDPPEIWSQWVFTRAMVKSGDYLISVGPMKWIKGPSGSGTQLFNLIETVIKTVAKRENK